MGVRTGGADRATMHAPTYVMPMVRRVMSDQVTPVLAYRRLVSEDQRTAPSFLFESVETGGRAGRYSMLGARPAMEIAAFGRRVRVVDHRSGARREFECDDPLDAVAAIAGSFVPIAGSAVLPRCFCGGWVGFIGYDTVRWAEPDKLPQASAPTDDRGLPDLHLALYTEVVVIDHVDKSMSIVVHAEPADPARPESADAARRAGGERLEAIARLLERHSVPLLGGSIDLDLSARPETPTESSFTREDFEDAVRRAQRYIVAGDIFQVVLSQRLSRRTTADPFDIYRALRIVNPSPYQIYLQAGGAILVAASPEILCRVQDGVVVNRPLAGTRRRGVDEADDSRLERELLADEKERAEHIMLVDLGRNDLGRVAATGSVTIERCMEVERYSHVMHISSTLTATLRADLDCWAALRSALPVGTVSGAPKVRAMQIIDELEPVRRGPYAGGIGCIGFGGDMDIALALRTMVVPTTAPFVDGDPDGPSGAAGVAPRTWTVHLQAGAGVVADSDPASEYEETISKAAALGRAIDLAESAFGDRAPDPV